MTDQLPDVTDPDIRAMVLRDHEPKELWTVGNRLISVHCSTCFAEWPCPSIQAAREARHVAATKPRPNPSL